jgi:hypothetical protein
MAVSDLGELPETNPRALEGQGPRVGKSRDRSGFDRGNIHPIPRLDLTFTGDRSVELDEYETEC